MQRPRVVLSVVLVLAFAACGAAPPAATEPALKYVPTVADVVAVIPTDFLRIEVPGGPRLT